jgi:hypothetical protein
VSLKTGKQMRELQFITTVQRAATGHQADHHNGHQQAGQWLADDRYGRQGCRCGKTDGKQHDPQQRRLHEQGVAFFDPFYACVGFQTFRFHVSLF